RTFVMRVAVLGYGQLGRALVGVLSRRDDVHLRMWTRSSRAEALTAVETFTGDSLCAALDQVEVAILAVSDSALSSVIEDLARLDGAWDGMAVLHTSGVAPPEVLRPLALRGASTAVCHPLRAFPARELGPAENPFEGTLFTLEGSTPAVEAGRRVVELVGGVSLQVTVSDRALYHLAAVVASNFGLLLRGWSARRFADAGLTPRIAAAAADALLRNALDNARDESPAAAVTGPIRRGDLATVESHVRALEGRELLAYGSLGLLMLSWSDGGDAVGRAHLAQLLEDAVQRGLRQSRLPTGETAAPAGLERRA
nr:DUF2520 domain-containing protein [Gemmatimonadota bacterium]